MIGALAPLLLLVAASAGGTVEEAWCARARELLADAPSSGEAAVARFGEASGGLFEVGSPIVARAREVVGEDAEFGAAFQVLAAAVEEACAVNSKDDAAATAAEVRELMARDARFAGVRRGDDLLDRLRHKLFLWLSQLFESQGMQRFAGSTRTIFFVVLAGVSLVFAVRVALRMRRREASTDSELARVEAARSQAFTTLRAQAASCLTRQDARGALLAGERALLARVGEHEGRAVRPARTHRELLAELAPKVASAVAPALGAFDVALFARDATLDDAARFLGLVDDAAASVTLAVGAPSRTP